MEYLKPLEVMERSISRDRKLIFILLILLALETTVLPMSIRRGNPLLIRTEKGIVLSEVEPWKLSVARMEGFARAYVASRFEWSESDVEQKKKALFSLVAPAVQAKLKDSLQAFATLAHGQKAKSYYVVEDLHFSTEDRKIEAQITRVLRIRNAALATPLRIEMAYTDAAISPENPFGLTVTSLDEEEMGTP